MIQISTLDHNGRGIGKLNNKIVFVENALPNEIVYISIEKEKKNYIEAHVNKIIKPSNSRVESPCPYFKVCGGCDLLHMNYRAQLKFKQEKIENISNKYLNKNIIINNIVSCDRNFYYRNKTTFQVNNIIGFYKCKTNNIVNIKKCLISDNLTNDSIDYLNKLNLKYINKIICKSSINELMIIIETDKQDLDISILKNIATSIYIKNGNEYTLVFGNKYITQKLGKYKYLVSPDSFFQINLETCLKLYSKIKEYVGTNKNVLDLYCGTGSISIFVSENNHVIGIEINKYAIEDAIKNAKLNHISDINFVCDESKNFLNNIKFNPDVIIVDPPRSGLDKATIKNIFKLNSQKLIYVSCDPMTLMRDLNLLIEKYEIVELTPFDMFPNTKHVECLVLLTLKQSKI